MKLKETHYSETSIRDEKGTQKVFIEKSLLNRLTSRLDSLSNAVIVDPGVVFVIFPSVTDTMKRRFLSKVKKVDGRGNTTVWMSIVASLTQSNKMGSPVILTIRWFCMAGRQHLQDQNQ